jgi:hypothetical protein
MFFSFFPGICKANPRKKKRKTKLFSSNHASSVVRRPQAYLGGLEYKNNLLELIHFPNGRIDKTGTVDTFQYYLTDHLGNIVVLFQDTDGDGAIPTGGRNQWRHGRGNPAKLLLQLRPPRGFSRFSDWG